MISGRDLRFGLRLLGKQPGLTAIVALTLALGLGATSSILTVVEEVILSVLPYRAPEQLVVFECLHQQEGGEEVWPISHPDFLDWRSRSELFEDLAAYAGPRSFNLVAGERPEHIHGEMVSAGYFRLLGLEAVHGRVFTAEEDRRPGDQRVILVSHDFWRSRFGGREDLVGETLLLNGDSYEVVGIIEPGFRGLTDQAQLWLPVNAAGRILGARYVDRRRFRWLEVIGRLRPEVPLEQAQAEIDGITAGLEDSYGDSNTGVGVRLHPLDDAWFADLRTRLLLLLGAAGLVLFIACTNVANLLLARAVARRGELGLRLALGASRGGLVRQLVTETLLLMGLGVVAGLGLAQLSTRLLIAASAVELRSFVDTTVDFRVAGAMLVVALLCGLGFGLAPALMASRFAAGELLKVGGKSSPAAGRRGFQSALVIGQVALALVLLMAFGILIQSFRELQHTELGFDAGNLLTARVDLKGERYAENAGKVIFARQAAERLSALPEVRAAAVSGPDMPTDTWTGSRYTLEDRTVSTGDERVLLTYHSVSPGYFRVLGIPVLRGRVFTPQDTAATPSVAVVSREMAERYWPGESPIDKRFKFGHRDNSFPWFTVVGMVGNVRDRGLRGVERPGPTVYFSLDQLPPNWPPILNFLIRHQPVPLRSVVSRLWDEVLAIDPQLPPYDVATMEERLRRQIGGERFLVLLMGLFAVVGSLLAALGIYGVVHHAVTDRNREIGIRMALGAGRSQVLGMIVARGLRLTGAGVAGGLVAGVGLTRIVHRLHPDLASIDPGIAAVTGLLMFAAALLASWVPARRATRIDPMNVLRAQ